MATKRRTRTATRRNPSKRRFPKSVPQRRAARQNPAALQQRVLRVFEEQADSLWSRFAGYCMEFAAGFNDAVGSTALLVEADPTTVRVAYPRAETELFMYLDKSDRLLVARVNNGC